ncbi:MAG: DUF4245 domain-containing protein [Corynebacterium sp.]|nr:DUF4245 domain-containing protein [Corynebacterium sp.]
MAEEKPRVLQNTRDILISLAVIVIVMVLTVGFTGMCTFNRGEPESGPVHEVDAHAFYELEAKSATFPLRDPGDIPEWTPNSARRIDIDGKSAPTVGWVIGKDSYMQLSQTAVSETQIAEFYARSADETFTVNADAGEFTVTIYPGDDDERAYYILDAGDVRLLASGAANREQYTEIFQRTLNAPVLNPEHAEDAEPDVAAVTQTTTSVVETTNVTSAS